jgi:hypothetical protein
MQPLLRIGENLLSPLAEYGTVLFLFLLFPPLCIHIILQLEAGLRARRCLCGFTVVIRFIVTGTAGLFVLCEEGTETSHVSARTTARATIARLW